MNHCAGLLASVLQAASPPGCLLVSYRPLARRLLVSYRLARGENGFYKRYTRRTIRTHYPTGRAVVSVSKGPPMGRRGRRLTTPSSRSPPRPGSDILRRPTGSASCERASSTAGWAGRCASDTWRIARRPDTSSACHLLAMGLEVVGV